MSTAFDHHNFELTPTTTVAEAPRHDLNLYTPELYVEKMRSLGTHAVRDRCTFEDLSFTLSDGSRYNAQRFYPETTQFDISATYTTPWCTDLKGFNTELGKRLAENGMIVTAVSPEQPNFIKACRQIGSVSLLHDAKAHHAILDVLDGKGDHEARRAISVGYSRGAMVGFGVIALAAEHGRVIEYADFLDPCLEHKVDFKNLNWQKLPGYLLGEAEELAENVQKLSSTEIYKLAKTFRLRPSAWLHNIGTGVSLFSGQAGDFIDYIPNDLHANIVLYTDSVFNHADSYMNRFETFPNVTIRSEDGYHMTGVDPSVRAASVGRVVAAQYQLQSS